MMYNQLVQIMMKTLSNLMKICENEGNVENMKREEGRHSEKIDCMRSWKSTSHPTTRIPKSCSCSSQKPRVQWISEAESGIINPLVSKQPEKKI